jgi:hypothetical protein
MAVTRFSDTGSHQGPRNVSVASASLSDITEAGVIVSRNTSGGGNAYARGWVNARLTSTTNCELWAHRTGNAIQTRIQVLDFSGMADSGGGSPQDLTHTELDDPDTFGSHALSSSYAIGASEYASPNATGSHSLVTTYAITASSLENTSELGAHTIGQTGEPQELSATTYASDNAVGAHSLDATYGIAATQLGDVPTHGSHTISTGYAISASAHINASQYGSHSLSSTYTLLHEAPPTNQWIGTPTVLRDGDGTKIPPFVMDSYQMLHLLGIR